LKRGQVVIGSVLALDELGPEDRAIKPKLVHEVSKPGIVSQLPNGIVPIGEDLLIARSVIHVELALDWRGLARVNAYNHGAPTRGALVDLKYQAPWKDSFFLVGPDSIALLSQPTI